MIGSSGTVEEARIGRSSGYPALDEVALGAARESRFAVPGGGTGRRGQLRYRFVLDPGARVRARRADPARRPASIRARRPAAGAASRLDATAARR